MTNPDGLAEIWKREELLALQDRLERGEGLVFEARKYLVEARKPGSLGRSGMLTALRTVQRPRRFQGLRRSGSNLEQTRYERILRQMQEKVRTRRYVMTLHADEEMDNDRLTIFDVERGILTGRIIEREKDHVTAEWKYLIEGGTIDGDLIVVVAKLSVTGKLVIITVYRV